MSAATILTLANGKGIDLLDPKPADIDFDAVAEHLAKEKRYNGATPAREYSVAEHCVRGARGVLNTTGNTTLAAYFLLHDAHEHTLKDDTTPKKQAIAELAQENFGVFAGDIIQTFKLLEYRQDVAIHAAAGLAWPPDSEIIKQVKHWDLVMFVTEWRDLMGGIEHPNWAPYAEVKPLSGRIIIPWDWSAAFRFYRDHCRMLLPALQARGEF